MSQRATRICLPLPLRLGTVNCYLLQTDRGFTLIDTASAGNRLALERALAHAGCTPGRLRLIILTHGDFDHSGNAAHLRRKFDAPVAMHRDDAGMVERGDLFWNRKRPNRLVGILAPLLFGFWRSSRFRPDLLVDDGRDLGGLGLEARLVGIPGHSRGSIGVVTAAGDLYCGDLFENTRGPALNSIMDDCGAARASVEKLLSLDVGTVYPGHGEPFPLDEYARSRGRPGG